MSHESEFVLGSKVSCATGSLDDTVWLTLVSLVCALIALGCIATGTESFN